ncbi:MAG: rRNA synthase [Acidobacteriaceae bacterium]|jgi:23S rRNA pseudouridine1911/1915/1917 synthase|nr:rRNA synthase [Acidobacteriaceae bacterium]
MSGEKEIKTAAHLDPEGTLLLSFEVLADETGDRLDHAVAARYPELSRTRVKELIDGELVLVDGKPSKAAHRLHAGEKVAVNPKARPPLRAHAESIPLDILFEDADIIAVNKPAGMTVHAGAGNATGTLVNALLGRGQSLSQLGDALRPGIVHRLDKETSGVILVAKTDAAHARLGEAFRQRTVNKTYIALVQGSFQTTSGRIELAIGRDPLKRVRMAAEQKTWRGAKIANSREARTDWRTLLRIDATTLLQVQLHTGRTHQIRVHFSALKHPVVGDTLYGAAAQLRVGDISLPPLGRNFLHAAKIVFSHPRTGERMEIRAPLPIELREFLHTLARTAGGEPAKIDAALTGYL